MTAATEGMPVATLTVRGLAADLHARLRVRAAQHGRSMEAEVRAILEEHLTDPAPHIVGLGSRVHARFAALGGLELDLPPRQAAPRAADFDP